AHHWRRWAAVLDGRRVREDGTDRSAVPLKRRQLEATLSHSENIDRFISGLRVKPQRKTVCQQRLEHRPHHHGVTGRSLRLCFHRITLRVAPARKLLNTDWIVVAVESAAGIHNVSVADEVSKVKAGEPDPLCGSRERRRTVLCVSLIVVTSPDGRNFPFRHLSSRRLRPNHRRL